MVKLNVIYTRTGDDGSTALVRGPRRSKDDLRVEAFGTIDEANCLIGMARIHTESMPKLDTLLSRVQNDLFDLGSDLATPGADEPGASPSLRITAAQTLWIERQIDSFNAGLSPLNSFVLPGGTPLAAVLHLGRTVVRRAERVIVTLAGKEEINPEAIKYVNRLSDMLFVLGRVANRNGQSDVLWVPGQNTGART